MALEIKGLQRVFKIRKGSSEIELADPDNSLSPERGDGFLFHDLSGTDHGERTRSGMRG